MTVDKTLNNAYIWYSKATDVTGKKLAEALGANHGHEKPALSKTSLVLGWGTKTKEKVYLDDLPVFNHPDNIRTNRNKLTALELMRHAKVSVASFCVDIADIGKTGVTLPVIGRAKYHQGGKGFWNCPTMSHVGNAQEEGADYFQNLIEIKDEFRLHIIGNNCVYAVKKVKRTTSEMEAAYIKHETERQTAVAKKNGDTLDNDMMTAFLRRQAKKFAQNGADMLVRSNRLGWKFVQSKTPNKKLVSEAVKACKAIGLDFGAVDCCLDVTGTPFVIEVNTGPGLEKTSFKIWTTALRKLITSAFEPKNTSSKTAKASVLSGHSPAIKKAAGNNKSRLIDKLALAQDMVSVADEEEATVLDKVFSKMFSD